LRPNLDRGGARGGRPHRRAKGAFKAVATTTSAAAAAPPARATTTPTIVTLKGIKRTYPKRIGTLAKVFRGKPIHLAAPARPVCACNFREARTHMLSQKNSY
jgi:hypothetical protein